MPFALPLSHGNARLWFGLHLQDFVFCPPSSLYNTSDYWNTHTQCRSKWGASRATSLGAEVKGCQQVLPTWGEPWDRPMSPSFGRGARTGGGRLPQLRALLGKHGDLCIE